MSSQVFARKYRPQTFGDVVGQETTVRILKNALSEKRLHHAYLFSGPRGIGKTTLARLLAKALNCEKGPTPDFCDPRSSTICNQCREIMEGRSLSVLEIDGASNTSVEDVRDLREKIRYLPPGGRYKVYIIDEVHMLSTAAFNALLKTLEEPPPHAILLFATTESQKIPPTVLSRLIRFDLRPISRNQITEQLLKITREENVVAEERALFEIAREAEGGLRDALSLLDQIVSFSGSITLTSVEEILGVSTRQFVARLSRAVLSQNSAEALQISNEALNAGVDSKRLGVDFLEYFRHLLVAAATQSIDDPGLFDFALSQDEIKEMKALAAQTTQSHLDRLFRILQKGVGEILRSPIPKILWDVLAIRLTQAENLVSIDTLIAQLETGPSLKNQTPAAPKIIPEVRAHSTFTETPREQNSVKQEESRATAPTANDWKSFLDFVEKTKPALYSNLLPATVVKLTQTELTLAYPSGSFQMRFLQDPDRMKTLTDLTKDFFKTTLTVKFQESEKPTTSKVSEDMMDVFGPGTKELE